MSLMKMKMQVRINSRYMNSGLYYKFKRVRILRLIIAAE